MVMVASMPSHGCGGKIHIMYITLKQPSNMIINTVSSSIIYMYGRIYEKVQNNVIFERKPLELKLAAVCFVDMSISAHMNVC